MIDDETRQVLTWGAGYCHGLAGATRLDAAPAERDALRQIAGAIISARLEIDHQASEIDRLRDVLESVLDKAAHEVSRDVATAQLKRIARQVAAALEGS